MERPGSSRSRWLPRLLAVQAGYYVLVGLWPVFHLRSFESLTGPKIDDWLVIMVGLLAAVIGAALGVAVLRRAPISAETLTLAITAALAFAGVDLRYALEGRISPVYLLDAALELLLVIAVIAAARGRATARTRPLGSEELRPLRSG